MTQAPRLAVANGGESQRVALTDTPSVESSVQLIDHIARSADLVPRRLAAERDGIRCVGILPREAGTRVWDHTGVWVDLG